MRLLSFFPTDLLGFHTCVGVIWWHPDDFHWRSKALLTSTTYRSSVQTRPSLARKVDNLPPPGFCGAPAGGGSLLSVCGSRRVMLLVLGWRISNLNYNTNLINDIMFTNSFEKYHLERAVSVEPIGDTDTALMRWYLKKYRITRISGSGVIWDLSQKPSSTHVQTTNCVYSERNVEQLQQHRFKWILLGNTGVNSNVDGRVCSFWWFIASWRNFMMKNQHSYFLLIKTRRLTPRSL